MENCNILHLGEFPHDADINTGLVAVQDGVHTCKLFIAGIFFKQLEYDLNIGDTLIFEATEISKINENAHVEFIVVQPDTTLFVSGSFRWFSFKTYINIV